jgi:hypothetical protein
MTGLTWLASYPKSGNTWARLFLQSLAKDGAAVDINFEDGRPSGVGPRAEFDRFLGVDSSDLTCDEVESARPRLYEMMAADDPTMLPLKVHDAWLKTSSGEPLFPPAATAGAIYIARDPRDVAVSLAHHLGITIDAAINMLGKSDTRFGQTGDTHFGLQVRQRLGSWSQHVTSWLDAPIRVFATRYEDMISDPEVIFAALAESLGWSASPEAVSRAIASTRFDELRRQEDAAGFIERSPRAAKFFRRGETGGWKDSLSGGQVARIEGDHSAVMARVGYL